MNTLKRPKVGLPDVKMKTHKNHFYMQNNGVQLPDVKMKN